MIIAVMGAATLAGACARGDRSDARRAPAFTLARLTGTDSLALSDLRGKYVLMNFWASWCGPCREEIPALLSIHRRFAGTRFTVLGVTVNDRPEDSRGFAREYGLPYPNVIGNEKLYEDYELTPWIPMTLLISPEGRVVKQWAGPQTEESFLRGIREAAPKLRAAADPAVEPSPGV